MRDALGLWRCSWQRQRCLRDRYQGWAQLRRQGLCRAMFQSWQQAAACQRHRTARPERLTLQRVLEAWAQSAARGRVQRVTISQFQLVGHRQLLRTQWRTELRTELLSVWLEPQVEAQETSTALPRPRADLEHWHGLAGRGRLLWNQARSCRPQGPRLPSPAQHRSLGGQRTRTETSGAQSDSAAQRRMQWPGPRAQGSPPPGPGGDCSSEGQGDKSWLGRKYLRRWHLEALLRRLQGSQQARRLAGTWQCWVDAQGAEELARSLLRQWQLRWVWRTWRRRVAQLRVARQLQGRAEGWVLSQALEKWHRNLAARGLRRGHRQPESPEEGGHRARGTRVWRTPGGAGAAAAGTCCRGKKIRTEPGLPREEPRSSPFPGVQTGRPQGARPSEGSWEL
ncbi:uncharacterized protein LOC118731951 [Pipistrellus kuhlii]|uniref:uncharacterized protein LOC118731951 n=1 Tax=Pipistrellus kuhlii TaxID=59472 RepID=UPI001E270B15|nr:uncharacterized protein LOC118731951 [Pipistrellus kuhlii]